MSGPNSKPERGAQDYRTPPEFLAAVLRRLGWSQFDWDLACEVHNCVGVLGGFVQPRFDALALPELWQQLARRNLRCWLNPPFGRSGAFARCCAESGVQVAALFPVAIGTRWWQAHVAGKADLLWAGRLRFNEADGTPAPAAINRDVALLRYPGTGQQLFENWKNW